VACFRPFPHYLEKVSHRFCQVQDTIITAWTIRHPTRNRNDPIARAELYQLSYIPPSQVEHAWRSQMLLLFFSLAQLGHPGLEPETSPVK